MPYKQEMLWHAIDCHVYGLQWVVPHGQRILLYGLIIAGMDCTYLLVRRKILRLYRLTPLWWWYENMGYGWMAGRYGVRVFILPLSLRQIPECIFMQFRSKKI